MPDRADDWLRQAERNLDHAGTSAAAGFHEWACFAAQQAAEMAVKAVHFRHGQEAWGHTVRKLLEELPAGLSVPEASLDAARALDLHYIPPRCPNCHPSGAPGENYGPLQSREAIDHARQILEFCRLQMARP